MKEHSRGLLISIASECLRRKSPRLKTFLSYLEADPSETIDAVSPQNGGLLNITYKPEDWRSMMTKTESLTPCLWNWAARTPVKEISSDRIGIIEEFLATEMEYRKHHRIKKLLRASGIKQVKTLSQFDWHFNPKSVKRISWPSFNSPWSDTAANLVLIGDTGLGKFPYLFCSVLRSDITG